MPWTRPLPAPIVLQDGRTLVTLSDARGLMRSLPRQRQRDEQWRYVDGLLLEAATGRGAMGKVKTELLSALRSDGLI
jgi:hypothetical protein